MDGPADSEQRPISSESRVYKRLSLAVSGSPCPFTDSPDNASCPVRPQEITRSGRKECSLTSFMIFGLAEPPVAKRPIALPPSCRREPHMPGNPKECRKHCRKHAARCVETAVATRTPQIRATFLELSKNCEKPAIRLENAFAQLAESQDIRSGVQETVNEFRQLGKPRPPLSRLS
jgi:hypothetical protein